MISPSSTLEAPPTGPNQAVPPPAALVPDTPGEGAGETPDLSLRAPLHILEAVQRLNAEYDDLPAVADPPGGGQPEKPLDDLKVPKVRRPRKSRRPIPPPPPDPLQIAAEKGDLQTFITFFDEKTDNGWRYGNEARAWKQLRLCLQNAQKNDPGLLADVAMSRVLALLLEMFERCRSYVVPDLAIVDESRFRSCPSKKLDEVMAEWAPRLSRLMSEIKEVVKLQAQVRHVNALADRERACRKSTNPETAQPPAGSPPAPE